MIAQGITLQDNKSNDISIHDSNAQHSRSFLGKLFFSVDKLLNDYKQLYLCFLEQRFFVVILKSFEYLFNYCVVCPTKKIDNPEFSCFFSDFKYAMLPHRSC